jgi:hypothetical protein
MPAEEADEYQTDRRQRRGAAISNNFCGLAHPLP